MIISDFHSHSENSGDSTSSMASQIQSAMEKGIKHLCFTEHLDFDYPDPPKPEYETCSFELDSKSYYEDYIENRKKISVNTYFGVEVGLMPHLAARNDAFVNNNPFDFVIASTHLIDGEDPYYSEYWEGRNEKNTIKRYFEYIYENISVFGNFDVCGHLDYAIRYCSNKDKDFSYSDYSDEIDTLLKKIISMGKGIEINTGGLKNGLKFPNPNPEIIKRYKELGGEIITVGSDAHSPEYIGYKFDLASDILNSCGFKYYTIFKNRKSEFLPL